MLSHPKYNERHTYKHKYQNHHNMKQSITRTRRKAPNGTCCTLVGSFLLVSFYDAILLTESGKDDKRQMHTVTSCSQELNFNVSIPFLTPTNQPHPTCNSMPLLFSGRQVNINNARHNASHVHLYVKQLWKRVNPFVPSKVQN